MSQTLTATLIAILALAASRPAPSQQSVLGERYAVTSGHPEATAVGIRVLRDGGNVVDAAIATSVALGVAEPYGSGIGGKGMLLYREASSGRVYAIEAMCRAPIALDPAEFAALRQRDRYAGYRSVATPGLVDCLGEAHRRWGSLAWKDLVTPAAELADHGVVVSEKMYAMLRPKRNLLRRDAEAARVCLVDGETPAVGSKLSNPDLAATLRTVADRGPRAFYEGPIAEAIVAACGAAGSPLSMADFAQYEARLVRPIEADFDRYRLFTSPPPLAGGATVLSTLRAVEGVAALEATTGRDAVYIDILSRALLVLYPRINRVVADTPTALQETNALLSDSAAANARHAAERFDPATAAIDRTGDAVADDTPQSSTTHLIVADRAGNVVCLTQSLSYHMGACVVPPGTGVILNNSMSNFSVGDPNVANHVAPGKRERSTIAPIIATRDGEPVLALGIPGGQRIPTTTLQLVLDILHFKVPLVEAFDRPRFHVARARVKGEASNVIDLEADNPPAMDAELESVGYQVARHPRNGHYFGGGSAVAFTEDGLQAVADLRRTNHAAGE